MNCKVNKEKVMCEREGEESGSSDFSLGGENGGSDCSATNNNNRHNGQDAGQ